jgi:hypothetical protein
VIIRHYLNPYKKGSPLKCTAYSRYFLLQNGRLDTKVGTTTIVLLQFLAGLSYPTFPTPNPLSV